MIIVDYKLLYDGIIALTRNLSEIKKEMDGLCRIVENLDIFWDGDTNAVYVMRVEEDLGVIYAVILKIREIIRSLFEAFNTYQQNDNKICEMIGGLRI